MLRNMQKKDSRNSKWRFVSIHSVFHNLSLGRGPLRSIVKYRDNNLPTCCRHGCSDTEDLKHVLFSCHHVHDQRKQVSELCQHLHLKPSIQNLFANPKLQKPVELLLKKFFT